MPDLHLDASALKPPAPTQPSGGPMSSHRGSGSPRSHSPLVSYLRIFLPLSKPLSLSLGLLLFSVPSSLSISMSASLLHSELLGFRRKNPSGNKRIVLHMHEKSWVLSSVAWSLSFTRVSFLAPHTFSSVLFYSHLR